MMSMLHQYACGLILCGIEKRCLLEVGVIWRRMEIRQINCKKPRSMWSSQICAIGKGCQSEVSQYLIMSVSCLRLTRSIRQPILTDTITTLDASTKIQCSARGATKVVLILVKVIRVDLRLLFERGLSFKVYFIYYIRSFVQYWLALFNY